MQSRPLERLRELRLLFKRRLNTLSESAQELTLVFVFCVVLSKSLPSISAGCLLSALNMALPKRIIKETERLMAEP